MRREVKIDFSLYLVTDRSLSCGRATAEIVDAAARGGVTCVQLREKNSSTRSLIARARALQPIVRRYGIPLIINDRIDVALAVGADGVHLGQSDMHISDARHIAGAKMIIGISVESDEDAVLAEKEGADYIGISPVFSTATKPDAAPPLGLEGIKRIRRLVDLPLVGIGGIHAGNAFDVIEAGADGVAVVSAIVGASCPENAAAAIRRRLG